MTCNIRVDPGSAAITFFRNNVVVECGRLLVGEIPVAAGASIELLEEIICEKRKLLVASCGCIVAESLRARFDLHPGVCALVDEFGLAVHALLLVLGIGKW